MGLHDQYHPSLYLLEVFQESVQMRLELRVLFLVVRAFDLFPQDGHEQRLVFCVQLHQVALVLVLRAIAQDRLGYQHDLGQEVIFQVVVVQECLLLVVYEDLQRALQSLKHVEFALFLDDPPQLNDQLCVVARVLLCQKEDSSLVPVHLPKLLILPEEVPRVLFVLLWRLGFGQVGRLHLEQLAKGQKLHEPQRAHDRPEDLLPADDEFLLLSLHEELLQALHEPGEDLQLFCLAEVRVWGQELHRVLYQHLDHVLQKLLQLLFLLHELSQVLLVQEQD